MGFLITKEEEVATYKDNNLSIISKRWVQYDFYGKNWEPE